MTAGTTSSDKIDLATWWCFSIDSRGLTDVTTTMRIFGGVASPHHAPSANSYASPRTCGMTGLQDESVNFATTRNDTDHGTVGRKQNLFGAEGQLDSSTLGVQGVGGSTTCRGNRPSDCTGISPICN